jgi:hypothetical protein
VAALFEGKRHALVQARADAPAAVEG